MHAKFAIIIIFALITTSYATGIPLPNLSVAQSNGIVAGMGIGTLKYAGCKTLWTWTAQGSYSYNSFLSSGPRIKFLGGNLDSENNIVNQKYAAYANFTYRQPDYALFWGPVASFEIIDITSLSEENTTECGDLLSETDLSLGYQSGIGFLITQNWGINFGHSMELMLNGAYTIAFSGAIAFNLRDQFENFVANTKNFWLFLEYSPTLIKANISNHVILGFAVGF